jgi:hypothetical protein
MADRSWRYGGSIEAHPPFYEFYAGTNRPWYSRGNLSTYLLMLRRGSARFHALFKAEHTSPALAQEHGHADDP